MEKKSVAAVLTMALTAECPECKHDFNLFDTPCNDEGDLYRQLLPDERWEIDEGDRLDTKAFCPECDAEFQVKGVIW